MPTTIEIVVWIILSFSSSNGNMTELSYKFASEEQCLATVERFKENVLVRDWTRLSCVPIIQTTVNCPPSYDPAPLLKPNVGSPS